MARIPIEMPRLGYDMETGSIAAWVKQVGDTVARGDVIAEIETEKSTVEMEALAGGTLVEQTLAPGQEVPVGTVIGYLEDGRASARTVRPGGRHDRRPTTPERCPTSARPIALADAATPGALRAGTWLPARARLPLRYWRQQAHFTTPAEEAHRAQGGRGRHVAHGAASWSGSASGRTSWPTAWGWTSALVERLLARAAPRAPGDARRGGCARAHGRGRRAGPRGRRGRPADGGLERRRPTRACASTDRPASTSRRRRASCTGCCGRSSSAPTDGTMPLDGIVFPKVEHPEEVDLVHGMLDRGRAGAGPAGGRHPGGVPRRIGLGRGAAAGDRAARRRPAVRPHLRARRLLRGPGPASHRQRAPARGLGARRRSWTWRARWACPPSTA